MLGHGPGGHQLLILLLVLDLVIVHYTRSAGCIFAELANAGRPLFPGSDVDDQIKRVRQS